MTKEPIKWQEELVKSREEQKWLDKTTSDVYRIVGMAQEELKEEIKEKVLDCIKEA